MGWQLNITQYGNWTLNTKWLIKDCFIVHAESAKIQLTMITIKNSPKVKFEMNVDVLHQVKQQKRT